MSSPVFPELRFVITLTGSMNSALGPPETRILLPSRSFFASSLKDGQDYRLPVGDLRLSLFDPGLDDLDPHLLQPLDVLQHGCVPVHGLVRGRADEHRHAVP